MELVNNMVGEKGKMNFEETELRLGIGFSTTKSSGTNGNGKRGFVESDHDVDDHVDLKLNLVSNSKLVDVHGEAQAVIKNSVAKPPPKAQVVGWPPVRSFRKNIVLAQQKMSSSNSNTGNGDEKNKISFVKVSLDGAPYLRKVDLKMYNTYQDLSDALGNMFSSFTIGNCGSQGLMDFMNESKLMDLLNNSDYVPTYEDKDGDWMLVGDVPWEMFVGSCKRLRIMKGTEAIGLAPRAMEKCKNRN